MVSGGPFRPRLGAYILKLIRTLFQIGAVAEMQKGDITGHEFCGKVEAVGPAVKNVKVGDRVVASFQIACGDCMYCKKGLSSQCEKTNASSTMASMYGGRTAGTRDIPLVLLVWLLTRNN